MAEYFNVTTNLGDVEITNAITNGTQINITHIAFGDGNGSVPTPNKARTTLVREVHRQPVTKYERHKTNPNWIVIETIIPSDIGGFTIREIGVIGNGKLLSYGSHAPYEKVADPTGVSEYRLKFTQNITDGSVVSMILDESLIYATQAWVDEHYVPRDEIVDNLTTDDETKPVSAKQAKLLQDNKLDANKRGAISGVASLDENKKIPADQIPIVDDLTTDDATKPVSAKQAKILSELDFGFNQIPVKRLDRLLDTYYVNSLPRPIILSITLSHTATTASRFVIHGRSASGADVAVALAGVTRALEAGAGSKTLSCFAIVPPFYSYKVTPIIPKTMDITEWVEY